MHIEFKRYSWDHPFSSPSSTDRHTAAFTDSTPNKTNTLGQIGAYAAAQLTAQYCTHCFSVYIYRATAHIIRWDREGAIVTELIHYNEDPSLVTFFSQFSQAPPELHGVDTMVSTAIDKEADHARCKLGLPNETSMLKTTVPGAGDAQPFTIIFAWPKVHSTTPFCRGTRACPTYDLAGDRLVFFKDSWCLDTDNITPKGQIYAELSGHRVPHVPQCLVSGDVDSWPEQKMQTRQHSQSPWACQKGLSIMPHTHYWLILDLVGEALTSFSSSKELVQAIHDTLVGELYLFLPMVCHFTHTA